MILYNENVQFLHMESGDFGRRNVQWDIVYLFRDLFIFFFTMLQQ